MIERYDLRPGYSISRVIKGGWHLAGGHGPVREEEAIQDMLAFVKAGITTFDCADIYTGVENLIGIFLKRHRDAFRSGSLPSVQIHTKYVPDYNALATLKKADTVDIIDRSLTRLGVERLDLVQFAWWDYNIPGYVEAIHYLADLQREGKIRFIGITNFDAKHALELFHLGVAIVAQQVQYSLLDHRPENKLINLASEHHIPLLCYGTVAGGFLSDKFLHQSEPALPYENRSLTKYRLIIDEFGGYDLFQRLLLALKIIAEKYQTGIAEIAMQYILQKEQVAAIIVGARNQSHLLKYRQLAKFSLDHEDLATINKFQKHSKGPAGPVYGLERDKNGKHGRIMKYNLNRASG